MPIGAASPPGGAEPQSRPARPEEAQGPKSGAAKAGCFGELACHRPGRSRHSCRLRPQTAGRQQLRRPLRRCLSAQDEASASRGHLEGISRASPGLGSEGHLKDRLGHGTGRAWIPRRRQVTLRCFCRCKTLEGRRGKLCSNFSIAKPLMQDEREAIFGDVTLPKSTTKGRSDSTFLNKPPSSFLKTLQAELYDD